MMSNVQRRYLMLEFPLKILEKLNWGDTTLAKDVSSFNSFIDIFSSLSHQGL